VKAGISISRGALLELRKKLELVKRGKEILEMRRDQLIGEAYRLLSKVEERRRLEERFASILREAQKTYLLMGHRGVDSYSCLVKPPKLRLVRRSLLGVIVPKVVELRRPDPGQLPDPSLRGLITELWDLLKEFIELAVEETMLELICKEISYLNRVVNSLEKRLIPQLEEELRYIRIRVEEQSLEEFVRIKKLRDRLRGASYEY